MALLDFLAKALDTATDVAASKTMQRTVEKGYQRGKISREEYDRYQSGLQDYKRKKGIEDDY